MEYFNNILCVEGGWLYKEGIMSKDTYDKMLLRGKMRRERLGGNGREALIAYESIPNNYQDAIKQKIGGDPYTICKRNLFKESIQTDPKALEFYRSYVLSDGRRLPVEYQEEYCTNSKIINAINIMVSNRKATRKALGGKTSGVWEKISDTINTLDRQEFKHSLPTHARRLQDTVKKFNKEGYQSLISGKFCNNNTEKINDEAKLWLLARWANQVDKCASENQLLQEYNLKAEEMGWKKISAVNSIRNYLFREDIKPLWWGYRYGELKAKEKFSLQLSTVLPSMRDSLWYSDGTKLNYYYRYEKDGKTLLGTINVYEVMDTYSEMLLGYHIAKNEDYEAQYFAYKMAIKTSGYKPYEIKYDNQGGHKKLESGEFFKKLSHLAINTQPYNGKSKTIENAFYRFQSQVLKRDWFFTGQNIQAKEEESKANMEFIMANIHNLPTLDELMKIYARRREEWNSMQHPVTGIPRNEMYYSSHNPKTVKVDMLDMVELFWITRKKPCTLTAYGLTFEEKGQEYTYLVYKSPSRPDHEWLRDNIDKKFIVKFDPEDMSMISLWEETPSGTRFITYAETKLTTHRAIQEQEDFERSWITEQLDERNNIRIETRDKMNDILYEYGMTAEQQGLVSAPIKGIEKKRRGSVEIGKVQKAMSMAENDEEDFDLKSLYNDY